MRTLLTFVFVLLLSLAVVSAAEPAGGSATPGASETGTDPTSTDVNISANNITYVTVSSDYITQKWAGFYGNISGSFVLSDSSGNNFYQWTIADMSGAVVYAANNSVNWGSGSFFPLAASYASPWLQGSGTDNFSNTFSNTEQFTSPTFFTSGNEVNDTPYVETFNSSGVAGGFKTYALRQNTTNQSIYAARVVDDADGFTNQSVDYQLLIPAFSVESYYFYVELP